LRLTDGSRIEADLFIDCTGPQARLLSAIDDSVEDWSRWMPFGRIALGFSDDVDDAATADRMRGSDAGWTIEWPLRGRTMTACLTIEGEGVAIARHRRLRPWVGNVLALGEAATALDPLHGMNLDVAQQAILLALELLPGRDFHPLETAEYNRRAEQLTRRVRDFAALHYPSSLKAEDAPESLARTLGQYRHRGRLPFHEDESVTRDSWTAALIGMGFVPEHADAQALVVPLDQAVAAMAELADAIDKTVAGLPTYHDYLARIGR
jgi:tryptophan halogenase